MNQILSIVRCGSYSQAYVQSARTTQKERIMYKLVLKVCSSIACLTLGTGCHNLTNSNAFLHKF